MPQVSSSQSQQNYWHANWNKVITCLMYHKLLTSRCQMGQGSGSGDIHVHKSVFGVFYRPGRQSWRQLACWRRRRKRRPSRRPSRPRKRRRSRRRPSRRRGRNSGLPARFVLIEALFGSLKPETCIGHRALVSVAFLSPHGSSLHRTGITLPTMNPTVWKWWRRWRSSVIGWSWPGTVNKIFTWIHLNSVIMMWNSILQYLSVSSLQSLNEILASGSKDDSKAAVEKQVKRHSKDHRETQHILPFSWCPHNCTNMLVLLPPGEWGERPAAEGEGGRGPGEAGGSQCRPGQRRRRRRWRGEGLEWGGPPAAHQSCQPVPCWNQCQVDTHRMRSGTVFSVGILVAIRAQPAIAVIMCLKKKKCIKICFVRFMCVKHEALHSLCRQLGYFKIEVCLTDEWRAQLKSLLCFHTAS